MKKYIFILLFLVLIAFKAGNNKSQYNVPLAARSITAGDIDLDGDNDIVIGHNYNSQTNWTGITIMQNDSFGYFIKDTFYFNGQHIEVILELLDSNLNPDLITQTWNNINSQIGIVFDLVFTPLNILTIDINDYVDDIVTGDIDNNSYNDIVVASNGGKFWGVLYNDEAGNLSVPEYHYVPDYFPTALACGDLNGDGRDDIVVCGQSTEVYFSYPDGFQLLVLETDNYKEGVSIVDFDLDGDNDILTFVGIPFVNVTSLIMYENQGDNVLDTLEEFYFQPMSSRFFVTDFNNDSLQDILFQLSDKSGYIIYYNQSDFQLGDPLFIPVEPYEYEGLRDCFCIDLDGNGYNDIIITRLAQVILPDNLVILFNDGNGNFVENPITNIKNPNSTIKIPILTCYPNPFKTETTFKITIKETAQAELSVYDLQGRLIISLTNNFQKGGQYFKIKWDGLDTGGKACKPGTYIAYLKVNGKICQSVKLIKLN